MKQLINKHNILLLIAIGYGVPVVIIFLGLGCIWFAEGIFMEALYDERYNHL